MQGIMPTRRLERSFWSQGYTRVAGVDEVGRGPLAGPVTVAAVLLPVDCVLSDVRDSKLVVGAQRLRVARQIRRQALAIGVGWAGSREIDELGLTAATRLAGVRALALLGGHDMVVLDGNHDYLGADYNVHTCVKADQSCLAVAAASIIAKVARDSYMELIDQLHPRYRFAAHKGYGTAAHLQALRDYGPTRYHRRSYAPVRQATDVHG